MKIEKIPAVLWGVEPTPLVESTLAAEEIRQRYLKTDPKKRPICLIMDSSGVNKGVFDLLRERGLPMQELTLTTHADRN